MNATLRTLLVCLSLVFCTGVAAQEQPFVELQGIVTQINGRSEKAIEGVLIQAVSVQGDTVETTTGAGGLYALKMPLGQVYNVHFRHKRLTTKYVELDATGIPAERQAANFELVLDMTLLENANTAQIKVLASTPIAKAFYKSRSNTFEFDYKHSKQVYKLLDGAETQ